MKEKIIGQLRETIAHDGELPVVLAIDTDITMDKVYFECSEEDAENYGLESLSNPKAIKIITTYTPGMGGIRQENLSEYMTNEMGGIYLKRSRELVLFGGGYSVVDQVHNMLATWLDVSPKVFQIKKLSDL